MLKLLTTDDKGPRNNVKCDIPATDTNKHYCGAPWRKVKQRMGLSDNRVCFQSWPFLLPAICLGLQELRNIPSIDISFKRSPQSPFSAQTPLAGSGYSICRYSRYQKPLDRMRSTLTPVRTRGDCRKGSSGLGGKRDRLAGWYCKPSPAPTVWTCLNDYCGGIEMISENTGLEEKGHCFCMFL
jgi:hypothetical protein